jgi:uncharacterized protein (DUF2062 family)
MSHQFLRQLRSKADAVRGQWYARPFGSRLLDPRLWSVQRRSVTSAFAAGLAICFIPLPVHLPLAVLVAILARVNMPVIVATVFIVNPFTVVPLYYAAYRFGALLLGRHVRPFRFQLSWDWLQYGLGPVWKPFLLGCLLSALVCSLLGWLSLEALWRWRVRKKYRERPAAAIGRSAGIG